MENENNLRAAMTGGEERKLEPTQFRNALMRGVILFAALCLIKCALLYSLRKELFQVHWRISGEPLDWVGYTAFFVFAALVTIHVWLLGKRCATIGSRAVRAANATVAGVALAFIVVTFHEGDKNYLSPLMNGILGWGNLGAYLSMDLFFRPPYLFVWIIGFVLAYCFLVRNGREHLALQAMAPAVGFYLLLNLRELAQFRSELVALDLLAVACLWAKPGMFNGWRWVLAFVPVCSIATVFLLFGSFDERIAVPHPEFQIIAGGGLILFLGAALLARQRGYLGAWLCLLAFALPAFLLLTTANFAMADNYRNLMLFGLALPRYFLGEAVTAVMVVGAAGAYRRLRPNGSLMALDVLILLCIALSLVDLRLAQIIGVRLDWQVLRFADSPQMIWRMAKPYLPAILIGMMVVAAAYAGLIRLLSRTWRPGSEWSGALKEVAWFPVMLVILLGFAGSTCVKADKAEGQVMSSLVKTSSWWRRIAHPMLAADAFVRQANQLGLSSMLSQAPQSAKGERALNVVLIFQESTYNQHLSLFGGTNDTQPLLSHYKDRMELFPNFFSNFAGSIYARFATFSGLYPVQDFKVFTKDPVPVKTLFDVLADHGYDCSVFYSSFADYTNFRDLLRAHGVKRLFDADSMPGTRSSEPVAWGLKEEETLGAIEQQINDYATNGKRFFLTYVPAAPHNPFDGTPERFRRFKDENIGDFTPRYLNELLYMDWVISGILDRLKETGLLDRTLVVITADHGEMLGGQGKPIGHGWAITPQLANVPLIIMDPSKRFYRVNDAIGSQVDVLPTVLDILGVPLPADEIYQGTSLLHTNLDTNRIIYLNSFRQFATIRQNTFSCGDRELGSGAQGESYQITNELTHTSFVRRGAAVPSANIDEFDHFQENFLEHYRDYVRLIQDRRRTK